MARVKTEAEIKARIDKTIADYQHVLECGPASLDVNAPRALMQLAGKAALDELCWMLGERRPRFACDDQTKRNH